ncbi:MAG TPA: RNA polymerase sigma factor [Gemmatimonadaceae bacterium]
MKVVAAACADGADGAGGAASAPPAPEGSATPPSGDAARAEERAEDRAEERALVERVRRGDAAAFEVLVRRHLCQAYAIAFRILLHREDAEDLVQEAFMAALDHFSTFDAERPFAPWLHRIVVNRGLNARKARARRRAEPVPDTVGDDRAAPDAEAEYAEVRERFATALGQLPERQRLVVRLIDVDGLEAAEVAEMLGVAPGTIRWYLHQARATLRGVLAPLRGGDA